MWRKRLVVRVSDNEYEFLNFTALKWKISQFEIYSNTKAKIIHLARYFIQVFKCNSRQYTHFRTLCITYMWRCRPASSCMTNECVTWRWRSSSYHTVLSFRPRAESGSSWSQKLKYCTSLRRYELRSWQRMCRHLAISITGSVI